MNRILVNENAARFEAAYDLLSNVVKSGLQTLVDNYLALEIGDFSIDVFNDLLKGGKKTRKAYISKIEKGLRKAGIRGKALDVILENAEEDLAPVMNVPSFDLSYLDCISFIDNKVVIKEDSVEALRERFRIYISDPESIRLYELHKQIIDNLNEIAMSLKTSYGDELPFLITDLRDLLIRCNYTSETFELGQVNYDFLARK